MAERRKTTNRLRAIETPFRWWLDAHGQAGRKTTNRLRAIETRHGRDGDNRKEGGRKTTNRLRAIETPRWDPPQSKGREVARQLIACGRLKPV